MPYSKVWDESTPSGQLPADQIDTAIQDTKISVRERLEQVIPNFGSDNVDPKRAIAVSRGTLAQRPELTTGGHIYIATDENKVYYTGLNGSWQAWPQAAGGATIVRGELADLPSPAETDFFFATDTGDLYANDGEDPPEFVLIGGGGATTMDPTIVRLVFEGTFDLVNPNISGVGNIQGNFPAEFPSDEYVPVAMRARIKDDGATPEAFTNWVYMNSGHVNVGGANATSPSGNGVVWIEHLRLTAPDAGQFRGHIIFRTNETGTHTTPFRGQIELFVVKAPVEV